MKTYKLECSLEESGNKVKYLPRWKEPVEQYIRSAGNRFAQDVLQWPLMLGYYFGLECQMKSKKKFPYTPSFLMAMVSVT